jgi:hypothetical protein
MRMYAAFTLLPFFSSSSSSFFFSSFAITLLCYKRLTGVHVQATRLLRLKKEIEDKFESEKWARISEAIVTDGGAKYPTAALQKKFKQLDKDGVSAASIAANCGVTASTGAVNNVNGGDDSEEDEDEE